MQNKYFLGKKLSEGINKVIIFNKCVSLFEVFLIYISVKEKIQ